GVEVGEVQQSIVADGMQANVRFQDVDVDADQLVGEPGQGFSLAIRNIGLTRVMIGAMCIGLARFCLDQAVGYAQERRAFGQPIGKLQGVSFPLAEAATELYAAENMLLNCAWKLDQGERCVRESSMVKLYCTEMLYDVADAAVQTHGGAGVMRELPLERVFRWARLIRIPEGTSEVQKHTIAKSLGL
ncbi:MAG: acyl-CoA dehydrogenase, partial [Candidatus Thermoplasmatota archaeon]|nr:acyl-CoA dehydrogenase [Candidatus Thermoplasmatota archaeon]